MKYNVIASSIRSFRETEMQKVHSYDWITAQVTDGDTIVGEVTANDVTFYDMKGSMKDLSFVQFELRQLDEDNTVSSINFTRLITIGRHFLGRRCQVTSVTCNHELGTTLINVS